MHTSEQFSFSHSCTAWSRPAPPTPVSVVGVPFNILSKYARESPSAHTCAVTVSSHSFLGPARGSLTSPASCAPSSGAGRVPPGRLPVDLPHPLRCVHLDLTSHMATERQAQAGPRVPAAPTQLITTEPRA